MWKGSRGVDSEAPAFSTKNRGTTLASKLWTIGSDDKQRNLLNARNNTIVGRVQRDQLPCLTLHPRRHMG